MRRIYGQERITERHRHRYEVNNHYLPRLEQAGCKVSGTLGQGRLVRDDRAARPSLVRRLPVPPRVHFHARDGHPLFKAFIQAALASATGRPSPSRRLRASPDEESAVRSGLTSLVLIAARVERRSVAWSDQRREPAVRHR